MGGIGSGQYERIDQKCVTDECRSIDVRDLSREGLLRPGTSFVSAWKSHGRDIGSVSVEMRNEHLVLRFSRTNRSGNALKLSQVVWLSHTPCNYGKSRVWFICPTRNCKKRVAILYAADEFACRNCLKLSYRSERENIVDRGRRRAQDIRTSLNGSANVFAPFPDKPKWMRWSSYWALREEAELCAVPALAGLREQLRSRKSG